MSVFAIPGLRLASLGISAARAKEPAGLLEWLGALQAQDYEGARWSIGLRLPGFTAARVEAAIAEGEILRTWPMRGTLHFVPARDAAWMLALMTPRVISGSKARYRELKLEQRDFERSAEVLSQVLARAQCLSRDELLKRLADAGIDIAGQRGYHLLGHAAQTGLICCGPLIGKQQSFRLLADLVPKPRQPEREEALGLLAQRYFRSHGPATIEDFARWTGLGLRDSRQSLSVATELCPSLGSQEQAGQTYWYDTGIEPDAGKQAWLLPGFDEYLLGYKDRSAVLDPRFAGRICPGGNGIFSPTIVIGGQVCGTWKRKLGKQALSLILSPLRALKRAEIEAVEAKAAEYAAYQGLGGALKLSWES